MRYDIPYPRVVSEYGKSPRRIIPVRASASLAKTPLSTASIELPAGETVSERAWIEMFTCTGSIGVFRVSGTRTAYGGETGSISLEHGAAEIGDYLVTSKIPDPDNDQDTGERTVSAAFTTIFSYYGGTMWSLGTVAASGNVTLSLDGENVLEAMLAVMEQLPGYYLAFDQTTTPWTVCVLQMPSAISAEGRLNRNVESAVITTDTSDQCNRLYMDGLPSPGYVQDTASITHYGVIARYQSGGGDDLDAAGTTKLVQEATKYVNAHKEPRRTIQISGHDFSAVTGESLDALQLCKLYRLALPDYGVTVDDNIISLTWRDIYNDPDGVDITLDEEEETIDTTFSMIKKETLRSTGGIAKNQKKQEIKFQQYDLQVTKTNQKFSVLATDSEWDELSQSGHVTAYTELTRTAHFVEDTAAKELPYDDWKAQKIAAYKAQHPGATQEEIDAYAATLTTAEYRAWITANPYAIYNNEYSDATRSERIISKTGINSLGQNETIMTRQVQEADRIGQVLGVETWTWEAVTPQAGANPSTNKWYELVDGVYVRSTDTTVTAGKTYYVPKAILKESSAFLALTEGGQTVYKVDADYIDMRASTLATWGVYTNDTLTAGIIAGKLNDDSTAILYGDNVLLSSGLTPTYTAVTNIPSGANPKALGYYEISNGQYVRTNDTTVISGKTYYVRDNSIKSHLDTIEKSSLWIGRDDLALINGQMYVDENGNVHIRDGAGLYVDKTQGGQTVSVGFFNEDNLTAGGIVSKINASNKKIAGANLDPNATDLAAWGVYTDGTLTGGVLVQKLNDNSTVTKILGSKIEARAQDLATWGVYSESTLTAGVMTEKLSNSSNTYILGDQVYIGNVTFSYSAYSVPSGGNPRAMDLFELKNGSYVLTKDESPVSGKTYYQRSISTGTSADDKFTAVDTLIANKVDTSYLTANYTTTANLAATYATITNLNALSAQFNNLTSTTAGVDLIAAKDIYVLSGGSGIRFPSDGGRYASFTPHTLTFGNLGGTLSTNIVGTKNLQIGLQADEENDGSITIKFVDNSGGTHDSANFNIAATRAYIDGVAARTAHSLSRITLSSSDTGTSTQDVTVFSLDDHEEDLTVSVDASAVFESVRQSGSIELNSDYPPVYYNSNKSISATVIGTLTNGNSIGGTVLITGGAVQDAYDAGKNSVAARIVGANDTVVSGTYTISSGNTITIYPATYVGGTIAKNTDYALTVDASARYNAGYTAGQNSVNVSKGTWASGGITFSPSAGTGSSSSVSLSTSETAWSAGSKTINVKDGSTSTGLTYTVNLPDASAHSSAKIGTTTYSLSCTIAGKTYTFSDIDTTGSYNDGVTAGQGSVSAGIVDGNNTAVSGTKSLSDSNTITLYPAKYIGGTPTRNTSAYVTVDATARYNAGYSAGYSAGGSAVTVNVNKGSWSNGQITFSPSAGTGSSQTIQINIYNNGWDYDDNTQLVYVSENVGSTLYYTGVRYTVDASTVYSRGYDAGYNAGYSVGYFNGYSNGYTNGENSVTINKGSWSNGSISFTKSSGTPSTKTVNLAIEEGIWSADGMYIYINDGNTSTGLSYHVDETSGYSSGYIDGQGSVGVRIVNGNNSIVSGTYNMSSGETLYLYPAKRINGSNTADSDYALTLTAPSGGGGGGGGGFDISKLRINLGSESSDTDATPTKRIGSVSGGIAVYYDNVYIGKLRDYSISCSYVTAVANYSTGYVLTYTNVNRDGGTGYIPK